MWGDTTRRRLLGIAGGIALAGSAGPTLARLDIGSAAAQQEAVDSYKILEGSDAETTVFVRRSSADGPTVMVVGGVHGDETSGIRAANDVKHWSVDAGTLVVLPEANQVAIEGDSRYGEDGDLNRQFPAGEEPTTELARAIWEVVGRHEPDAFIDLHRALGIYPGDPTGVEDEVGQAIFHSGDAAAEHAREAAAFMNANAVPDSRPRYKFETAHFDYGMEPSGLLTTKVALDRGARSYLVEVTSEDQELATRTEWHRHIVRRLLVEEGLLPDGAAPASTGTTESPETEEAETETEETETAETEEQTPTPEENSAPKGQIATEPPNAESVDFDEGDTVTLDAASSSDGDGEIVTYEWDVDDDGDFEETGETVELTLSSCGSYPVTLQVTDDDGATATKTITLTTIEPDE